jgi:hypothetical protein
LVDKIRSIPNDNIPNDGNENNEVTRVNVGDSYDSYAVDNESLIINTSEDYERRTCKVQELLITGEVLISRMLL